MKLTSDCTRVAVYPPRGIHMGSHVRITGGPDKGKEGTFAGMWSDTKAVVKIHHGGRNLIEVKYLKPERFDTRTD